MLGQMATISGANSPSGSRFFTYEVTGLRQNETNDKNKYPVRKSGSVFIKVPHNRMNEEMRRITRMGGTIVNIHPINSDS